jgi:hypothetical protein
MDRQNELNQLALRLKSWRRDHSAPTPIPPEIWRHAAELASVMSVATVAKTLRLDYSRLKRFSLDEGGFSSALRPAPTFVELRPMVMDGIGQCVVEVESARGSRMKIKMENPQCSNLAALIRDFVA